MSPICAANTPSSPPRMRARRPTRCACRCAPRAATRLKLDWSGAYLPPKPTFLGTRTLTDYPIAELVDYIDWTPFFSTWELQGKYPAILDDAKFGQVARSLFEDARAMLDKIVAERWFTASAAFGFWPANAQGDDIAVYADEARAAPIATLHTLRQQLSKREGRFNEALSDFVAPRDSGLDDYIGAFAVTAGIGEDDSRRPLQARQRRLFRHHGQGAGRPAGRSLSPRRLHQRVRREFWGYAADEALARRRPDRREISRHPPGARLSGAARPHRERHAVPPAARPSASASN